MKIISNIRDYYDSALQYSDDVVYRRTPSTSSLTGNRSKSIWDKIKAGPLHFPHIIGFCGKLYPVCVIDSTVYYPFREQDVLAVKAIYDKMTDDRRFVYDANLRCIRDFLTATGGIKEKRLGRYRYHHDESEGSYEIVSSHDPFIELGVPSFFIYKSESLRNTSYELLGTNESTDAVDRTARTVDILTVNPILSQLGFVKVVDPYTACQEIEMYLGRLAHPEDPAMPVGNDKTIAESKGYDRWSFRKMPWKHTEK